MKVHELKCDPKYFQAIYNGVKSFEIRINDRNFLVGDSLYLREYNRETQCYSGRYVIKRITYIVSDYGLPDNIIVMAII